MRMRIKPCRRAWTAENGSTFDDTYEANQDLAFFEDEYEDEGPLDSHHPYWAVREKMTSSAMTELTTWKRDTFFEGMLKSQPSFRLACPYYRRNPDEYLSCLLHCDLRTTTEVKQHLWRAHRQPPYCPACCATFRNPFERDRHIRSRTCRKKKTCVVGGVSERQRLLLSKATSTKFAVEEQWYLMWHIMFPTLLRPKSPYLGDGLEGIVMWARVFWEIEGKRFIANFLQDQGIHSQGLPANAWAVSRIYVATLEDLIRDCTSSTKYNA